MKEIKIDKAIKEIKESFQELSIPIERLKSIEIKYEMKANYGVYPKIKIKLH